MIPQPEANPESAAVWLGSTETRIEWTAPAEASGQAQRLCWCDLADSYEHPEKTWEGRMTFPKSYRASPMPADNSMA